MAPVSLAVGENCLFRGLQASKNLTFALAPPSGQMWDSTLEEKAEQTHRDNEKSGTNVVHRGL